MLNKRRDVAPNINGGPKSISLYSTLVRIKWAKEKKEATISLFL